jgi:hypothetical protein
MSSVWLEFSKWRPGAPASEKTSYGRVYRFGWLTVGFSKFSLSSWIAEWRQPLTDLAAKIKPRDDQDDRTDQL